MKSSVRSVDLSLFLTIVQMTFLFAVSVPISRQISSSDITRQNQRQSLGVKCPVQSPSAILGRRRHLLQHFTPNILCDSSSDPDQSGSTSSEQTASNTVETNEHAHRLAGCSPVELSSLAFAQNSHPSCDYHMTCQYDPTRYPAVLYEATRNGQADGCPLDQQCVPIEQTLDVLYKRRLGSCSYWLLSATKTITGYRCQKMNNIEMENQTENDRLRSS